MTKEPYGIRTEFVCPKKENSGTLSWTKPISAYSIHPGVIKMYMDLRQKYWWNGMKVDIAHFVAHCDTCQRVKDEHQKPTGLLQPLPIPI